MKPSTQFVSIYNYQLPTRLNLWMCLLSSFFDPFSVLNCRSKPNSVCFVRLALVTIMKMLVILFYVLTTDYSRLPICVLCLCVLVWVATHTSCVIPGTISPITFFPFPQLIIFFCPRHHMYASSHVCQFTRMPVHCMPALYRAWINNLRIDRISEGSQLLASKQSPIPYDKVVYIQLKQTKYAKIQLFFRKDSFFSLFFHFFFTFLPLTSQSDEK